jgi:hypothetical protein
MHIKDTCLRNMNLNQHKYQYQGKSCDHSTPPSTHIFMVGKNQCNSDTYVNFITFTHGERLMVTKE